MALAARSTADLAGLAKEIGAQTFACDASKRADVEKLFADLDGSFGAPEIVIYNPSYRTRGPIAELDPAEVEKCADGDRVRRLPGRAAGGQADAAEEARLHRVHRRLGQREGLCPVGAVRDGQVRAARAVRRAWRASCIRRASTSRMW